LAALEELAGTSWPTDLQGDIDALWDDIAEMATAADALGGAREVVPGSVEVRW
jgi:hypothetical protein